MKFRRSFLSSVHVVFAIAALLTTPRLADALTTAMYEAEACSDRSSDAVVSTEHFPYFGTGYLDFGGQGSYAEWNNVNVSTAGAYALLIRYANGTSGTTRACNLTVNGSARGAVSFPCIYTDWTKQYIARVTVTLAAGSNTIRLTANSAEGGPNIDNIAVSSGALSSPAGATFPVTSYGAKGDGTTDNTTAIQNAINACTAGGTVVVPAGTFMSGHLKLKSNMTLWLSQGAVLKAIQDNAKYPDALPATVNANVSVPGKLGGGGWELKLAFIWADNAENLTIRGGGTIDGNGNCAIWDHTKDEIVRPMPLYITRSKNVEVRDIQIQDAAMWDLVFLECTGVAVDGIVIHSIFGVNKDGIDICDCHDVTITNCAIWCEDDAICPKSGSEMGIDNLVVRNVSLVTTGNLIKFGTLSYGSFKNSVFEDITMQNGLVGIAIQVIDGADVDNITYNRIKMTGQASPVYMMHGAAQRGHRPVGAAAKRGSLNGVSISNVEARNVRWKTGAILSGTTVDGATYRLTNIALKNVTVNSFLGGRTTLPANPPEYGGQYPEVGQWGDLPAWGYFVRHGENITFSNCSETVSPADVRPARIIVDTLVTSLSQGPSSHEAENSTGRNDCVQGSEHRGFSGTGYLDFGGQGAWCEWNNVTVASAGTHTLSFRYANYAAGNRSCRVLVNGTDRGVMDFPAYGLEWDYWTHTAGLSVPLNAGHNTIRLVAEASGGPNVDRLDVDGGSLGESLAAYASHQVSGKSVVITTITGQRIRCTSYGTHMVRVQAVRNGEEFFADDRNAMVERHDLGGSMAVSQFEDRLELVPDGGNSLKIVVQKRPLLLSYTDAGGNTVYLREQAPVSWDGTLIGTHLQADGNEHFCGLGHGFFGRVERLDLKGSHQFRNYGLGSRNDQAPQIVPFYMSSKRYGVFLNTTFRNRFAFAANGDYSFGVDDEGCGGRLDYFVFVDSDLAGLLKRYIGLTGRPRLPQKSMFGLRLSDKADPNNEGESWWKSKITALRAAGYPFDVVINDNRWRSGSGALEGSWFVFDPTRYPDPARYKRWCDSMGVTVSLDINRNNNVLCPGWQASYNLPNTEGHIPWSNSAPDYSNPLVGQWQWGVFWNNAFKPSLGYPGDCIWIDETDDLGGLPSTTVIANGRTWAEMNNYYPFLIAQSVGLRGWDAAIGEAKRPYTWTRAGTAGMQRYIVMWSGDIDNTFAEMKLQLRGMLASGLSGFPYFDHDAGGFWNNLTDDLYQQWAMAMGAFSPIWRPHGPGLSRWPIDRNAACQAAGHTYGRLRYTLMPYIYSLAHEASRSGYPMAIAMPLKYPSEEIAWKADLQYLFGPNLLAAPNPTPGNNTVRVWLPGDCAWYDYWNDSLLTGGREIDYYAPTGVMPLFARQGAIIPQAPYRQSTFWLPKDTLVIDVYTGKDGAFTLFEDDDVTEKYQKGEVATTALSYTESENQLTVAAVNGTYVRAPTQRAYRINFHGLSGDVVLYRNGALLDKYATVGELAAAGTGRCWNGAEKILTVYVAAIPVSQALQISRSPTGLAGGGVKHGTPRMALKPLGQRRYILALENMPAGQSATVLVTNVKGAVVLKRQMREKTTLNFSPDLAAGMYYLKVLSGKQSFSRHLLLMK